MNRNLDRLQSFCRLPDFTDLRRWSQNEPEKFWPVVLRDLQLTGDRLADPIFDGSLGAPWGRWMPAGRMNLAEWCLAMDDDEPALDGILHDGTRSQWTYRHLAQRSAEIAVQLGDMTGQIIGVQMPTIPETAAAFLGIWIAGGAVLPLFSGFAPPAVIARLRHARAAALIVAGHTNYNGKHVPLEEQTREIKAAVPTLRRVLVHYRQCCGDDHGEPLGWPPLDDAVPVPRVPAEQTAVVAYTSGSTGAPKAAVHGHGGFGLKVAAEAAYQLDIRPGSRLLWCTDVGWIMYVWELIGTLANGATLCTLEGGYKDLSSACSRLGVTHLGISPTLGKQLVKNVDVPDGLRCIGTTGEPWTDEDSWNAVRAHAPIVNLTGGTEVGTNFLSHHLDVDTRRQLPGEIGGPSLGMRIAVPHEGGELQCAAPWPGMTRGLLNDPQRYLETYWSDPTGLWSHGDRVVREGRRWYVTGRLDDEINVAGRRISCLEVEEAAESSPAVLEACCLAERDHIALLVIGDPEAAAQAVVDRLGAPYRPADVALVLELPRTPSGKLYRRVDV